jgi:transcriptional regulator with XRE-family HTH domain
MRWAGRKMKALRVTRGRSLAELGQQTGIDPSVLSRLERDIVMPGEDYQKRIRKALGWTDEMDNVLEKIGEVA